MNILITGANGFIGRKLINVILSEGHAVWAIDREVPMEKISDKVKWIGCSLEDIAMVSDLPENIDVCFHLAWGGNSGNARGDYKLQLENVENSIKLIHYLASVGCKRFVGAGTLAEYDVENYIPLDGATPNLTSEYGIAKLAARYFTKAECNNLKLEHVWCFLSNTYGEGNYTNNFINFAAKRMLTGERAAFTEGKQMYDFMYVEDTVRAIYAAGVRGKNNSSYYLGSGKARPLKEYIIELRDAINPDIELFLGEIPFNGISLSEEVYDSTKLFEDTGFRPQVDFSDGIVKTIAWLKEEA